MYAANFDYYRASSVAEAIQLLQEHKGAKLLAGGQSLIPRLKLRATGPTAVVDIGRISELKGIKGSNGAVRIGALTTYAELASSNVLGNAAPIIAEVVAMSGDPAIRNRGTIGGNVSNADPASDMPTVLTALRASFSATGPDGERTIEANEFFQGAMTTALGEDEVLTAVDVPAARPGQVMSYSKCFHPASRYAVVGAAAVVTLSDGVCSAASLAVGGLVPRPAKAASVESALVGKSPTGDVVNEAAGAVADDLGDDIIGDVYASAEYRQAMARVYLGRALSAAIARAS